MQLSIAEEVEIARYVMRDGWINALGCKVPVRSNWNLQLFESLCTSRSDKEVATFLQFGWPIDRNGEVAMMQTYTNHGSANRYQTQVSQYVVNELKHGTLLGPLVTSPFTQQQMGVSPLSTRPKRNSNKRHVIMDLSWPHDGKSVNAGIDKNTYLSAACNLTYPTVDVLCYRVAQLVKQHNMPIYGWKKDMSRAFKQVPLDPSSWAALGFCWMGALFFDKTAVMGCRSAPYICQRTTNAIRHFMYNISYVVYNYIDDFMSLNTLEPAWRSYTAMGNLLRDLGVNESMDKAVEPTQIIEFLGVLYNLIDMTIELPQDKLQQLKDELHRWVKFSYVTRNQLQKMAGKLQFVANCVCAGRVLINRLYDAISSMQDGHRYIMPEQVLRDLCWWKKFLYTYNGKSIMWLVHKEKIDNLVATDASLMGLGGFSHGNYFRKNVNMEHLGIEYGHELNIAHLELLAIIVAVRIWKDTIRGKKFVISCDNQAVVMIINHGRSRNQLLQNMLRQLMYELAMLDAELHVKHIFGVSNTIPDILSRWNQHKKFRTQFELMMHDD